MPLSLEDQEKTVVVSVMEQNSDWGWTALKEMEFLVPADGVILLNIGTTNETRALTIDVSKAVMDLSFSSILFFNRT